MFITNPFPGAFGLDIGDLSLKLVQLRRRRSWRGGTWFSVETMRSVALPPGCIVNGDIEQPELVRKKILHLLGEDGTYRPIRSRWVVTALPEPKTFLKLIEIPTPEKDLLFDDISYHAAKHLPFAIEDTYLDWQVLPPATPGPAKTSLVLIAAAPKIVADSYTYLLEACGLNPLALELEAASLSRTLITGSKDYTGEARAIVYLGGTRSSLIIYDKNAIQFSMTLSFSGELMTTALAQGLKVTHDEAEKLKIESGMTYDKSHPRYLTIADHLLDILVKEIRRALSFYKEHFPATNPVTHITMCGGLAGLSGLDTALSHKIKITAAPGNVWKNVSPKKINEEKQEHGVGLATVIGLALRAAQNPLT